MRYFTADTHFNHNLMAEMRQYGDRPWKSTKEHDQFLIHTWNSFVERKDEVWHLGDFCFGTHEIVRSIRAKLNGKIHLILGNHDYQNRIYNIKDCFTSFNDMKEISIDKHPVILCHYAMRVWSKSHYNSWQLYAHSHSRLGPIGKQWDVGLDNNNFRILSELDIKEIMAKREDNLNFIRR